MARPTDLERRADLAEQAFAVICRRGVRHTTMSDLAAELGVKRPTLYFHFADFDAILDAVVARRYGELAAHIAGRAAAAKDAIDYLHRVMLAIVDFFEGREQTVAVMFELWAAGRARDPELVVARGRAFVAPLRAAMVARLEEGMRAGEVARCDAGALVDLLFAFLDGAMVQRLVRDVDQRALLKLLKTRFLDPLALAPPRKKKGKKPHVRRA